METQGWCSPLKADSFLVPVRGEGDSDSPKKTKTPQESGRDFFSFLLMLIPFLFCMVDSLLVLVSLWMIFSSKGLEACDDPRNKRAVNNLILQPLECPVLHQGQS